MKYTIFVNIIFLDIYLHRKAKYKKTEIILNCIESFSQFWKIMCILELYKFLLPNCIVFNTICIHSILYIYLSPKSYRSGYMHAPHRGLSTKPASMRSKRQLFSFWFLFFSFLLLTNNDKITPKEKKTIFIFVYIHDGLVIL